MNSQFLLITLACTRRYTTFKAHSTTLQKGGATPDLLTRLALNVKRHVGSEGRETPKLESRFGRPTKAGPLRMNSQYTTGRFLNHFLTRVPLSHPQVGFPTKIGKVDQLSSRVQGLQGLCQRLHGPGYFMEVGNIPDNQVGATPDFSEDHLQIGFVPELKIFDLFTRRVKGSSSGEHLMTS